jgi:phage-related protein (TIGR01555 family)
MNRHGGKREGAGRKKNPEVVANDNVVELTSQAAKSVPAQPAVQRPMFSDASVQALIDAWREKGGRGRPRSDRWNPYIIRNSTFGHQAAQHIERHMPAWAYHLPKGHGKRQLATDDASSLQTQNQFAIQAWQAGGLAGNDFAEGMMFLGYSYLSELAQRAEFRMFGEITSEEMTRKWIEIRGTDDESIDEEDRPKDKNKDDQEAKQRREATGEGPRSNDRNKDIERKIVELRDYMRELKLQQTFKHVSSQNEYFGIAHVYLDLDGADINNLRDPENAISIGDGRDDISKAKLGKNCLRSVRVIEPVWCYPIAYNASNPLSPDWYDPQVWYVMGTEIHKTRLIPFIGRPVPDILKPAYAFGGVSMTQLAQPYVDIWLRTRESVGEIIHAFSIMCLSTNLGTITQPGGAGGGAGDVVARMIQMNMVRDNQGLMLIDKATEDFKNISAPLGSLDKLQAQAQEHMFSVARIPAVKFTGIQPDGLNASSEGEIRTFYDTIHGQQEHLFRTGLTTVLDIAQISLWGARDPDITYDFVKLHEETPKEKAEIQKLEAETAQIRIDSGVISQEEERERLVADTESGYHGLDPDDVPDLLSEEMTGLIPAGAGRGLEAELGQAGQKKPKQPQSPPPARGDAADGGIQDYDDDESDLRSEMMTAQRYDTLGYLKGLRSLILVPDRDVWNAEYDPDDDAVIIQQKAMDLPAGEHVRIFLHEGGHRAQYKVARKTFSAFKRAGLGTLAQFKAMANEVHQEQYRKTGKVQDLIGEVFAESYARFILGMNMPNELLDFWKKQG